MGLVIVNAGSCPGLLTPIAVMKHLDTWPFTGECSYITPVYIYTCCRIMNSNLTNACSVYLLKRATLSTLGGTECLEPLLQI